MKKIHYLMAAVVCLLTLSACEGDTYYPTEYVYQYNKTNLNLYIDSNDWQWSREGNYYYYTFNVPELTQTIYDYGTVHCYREFNQGAADAYQIPLPHIFTKQDGTETYQQFIDFSYLTGQVEIALTNSDLKYDTTTNPESMYFHLVLVW